MFRRSLTLTLIALFFVLLLAWDASGLDLALAQTMGAPTGFPLRRNIFLSRVMHDGGKAACWMLLAALMVAIRWPFGCLRRLDRRGRVQLVITVLASVALVNVMKRMSGTSCPWDLQAFGGVARYVSHWSWGVPDGGGGHCFPGGHASAAFAYVGGYFVWRRVSPSIARRWLAAAVIAGLLFGFSQQWRGAHFMSHTLWTAWLCWVTGYVVDAWMRWPVARKLNET
ncbi:MAG: phosphatase PAP2 family protein [Burkholderiaceae bacterium]|jgi:membrane-associated PAP2 superfamily phosphatase|nr:phosphatase PAP2 family protein [Burkholderiaceae bacterium]